MKKNAKRLLSLVLAIVLTCSLMLMPVSAAPAEKDVTGNQYQTVFIHGLMGFGYNDAISNLLCYWGMTSGNMINYLKGQGYDVVNAAVGPCSSCWDRCCELYAQLTGTKTDYGAAHSAAVEAAYANEANSLKHDRFGRDYTGGAIVDNWGPIYGANGKVTGWYDNKLNLIGHSFGGPTSCKFLQLLAEGDANEIAWGKQQAAENGGDWHDYVSPLFWGDYDGEYLINSVTSLAGVLNGTTYLDTCNTEGDIIMTLVTGIANTAGLTDIAYLYDFQLEHFGISKTPGQKLTDDEFFSTTKISKFLDGYDNALWDLSIAGCNDLKQGWGTYDNVYYFSYAGDNTTKDPITGNYRPNADMMPLFISFSTKMGKYTNSYEQVKDINGKCVSNIDKNWLANDGMVNTISARYPIGAANKPYDAKNVEPGIWQWKDIKYDHLTFCGGLFDPRIITTPAETQKFYKELMFNIGNTTPIDKAETDSGLPFIDVPKGYWAYDYIKDMYEQGIVSGKSATIFDPDGNVTRGQFVTMLGRMAGVDKTNYNKCAFADVNKNMYYAPYIQWASENGIVYGYDAKTFAPDQSITRQQMAVMIARFCDYQGIKLGVKNDAVTFADNALIADYAKDAVSRMQVAGIISGYSNGDGTYSFNPQANATRAQTCAMLSRL